MISLVFLVILITPTKILANLGSVHRELLFCPLLSRHCGRLGFLFLTFLLASPPPGSFCPHSFHTWEANWIFLRNPENFTPLSAQAFFLFCVEFYWPSSAVQRHQRIVSVASSTFHILEAFLDPRTNAFLLPDGLQGCRLLHKMATFLSTKVYSVFFFHFSTHLHWFFHGRLSIIALSIIRTLMT